ncbi:MAG: hypothetical protein EOO56_17540 [Hymenobacter sp.]|nr:MAG: hypothetical protein EOO56_17540 [Hymenobacter sp.]
MPKQLSYEEFQQTFQAPMQDVTETAEPPLDIWPYVRAVPSTDLEGCQLLDEVVEHVWRSASGQFEHVCVSTESANIFLVIVVDLFIVEIYGHHFLNLSKEYGLSE